MWKYFSKNNPEVVLGLEAILVDEKGERIQASVKQRLIKKFGSDLKEGEYLDVMNFEVLVNNGDYRGTTHPYKFNRERKIPEELMILEGRKIIWIIRVKGTEKNYRQPSFNIVRLSDEPDVIHNFHTNMTMEVRTPSDVPLSSSTCSAMQVENISSEANNNGLPPCSPVTPSTKRQGSHIIDDEAIQESSTKSKRTSKKARGESDSKVENMKKESTKAKH